MTPAARVLTACALLVGCDGRLAPEEPAALASAHFAVAPASVVPLDEPPPRPGVTPLRILFIGNSLTEWNGLPALVKAMAASGGRQLEIGACTPGGFNLEDHWRHGPCRRLLNGGRWDVVVLQQGPSSLPESAEDLLRWSLRWADEIRAHKAKPAHYMVWPYEGQREGFSMVSRSYRAAAKAAKGAVFPAGEAWRIAIEADGSVPLYQPDHLHPTMEGTYLAALVITRGLTGIKADAMPTRLRVAANRVVDLPVSRARWLQSAAEKIATDPGSKGGDPGSSPKQARP